MRLGLSTRLMRRRHYREFRRFLALRACWSVLRGESVAWKLALTGDSEFETLGNGLFTADCTVDGKPLGPEHLYHGEPEGQQE